VFDIAGTQFEKGQFDLTLEGEAPLPIRWATRLGPIRGRMVTLAIIAVTGYFSLKAVPSRHLFAEGYFSSPDQAILFQKILTGVLLAIALTIQGLVMMFRTEVLVLSFNRARTELRFLWTPRRNYKSATEGLIPFRDVTRFRVHGPDAATRSPHGFLELRGKNSVTGEERALDFRFMTDEQRQFFPLNLSKLMDRTPDGDWVDPESEMVSP